MIPPLRLSIVVAVQHAQSNLPDIMRALRPGSYPEVEFLFCHTSADRDVPRLIGDQGNVRALCGPCCSLIPHLWRDGILAARGDLVATTTAHCIPAPDWVGALLGTNLENAALGGTIANDATTDAKAQTIHLLRYAPYAPPEVKHKVQELAADNAVYRRSDLLRQHDLLQLGFWEPAFHHRFRAEGICLELDPGLQVVHRNRYSTRQFIAQRLAHGREFGLTRARARPVLHRILLALMAPGIVLVLLGRILLTARRKPDLRKQLAVAWFYLPVFVAAWVWGEMCGYLVSLRAWQA